MNHSQKIITKCDGIITNCHSLVYYKVRWTVITNCDSFFITKCDPVYYKLRQVLQSAMDLLRIATGITKCDDYYKLRQYSTSYGIRCCQRSFTVNDQIYRLNPLSYFRFTLCNLLVTNRKVPLITITFCSASSGFRGGVCSRAANTSNSGSGGPGFKPPRSTVSFS